MGLEEEGLGEGSIGIRAIAEDTSAPSYVLQRNVVIPPAPILDTMR